MSMYGTNAIRTGLERSPLGLKPRRRRACELSVVALNIDVRHRPLDDRHIHALRHHSARAEDLELVWVRLDIADLRRRAGDAEAAVAVEGPRVDHAAGHEAGALDRG